MLKIIFTSTLNLSLIASIAAIVVIFLRFCFYKHIPKITFTFLWLVVLFRLLIPVSIPSPTSLFNALHQPSATEERGNYMALTTIFVSSVNTGAQTTSGDETKLSNNTVQVEPNAESNNLPAANSTIDIMNILSLIWLCGAISIILFTTVLYIVTAKKISNAVRFDSPIIQQIKNELKVKRNITVLKSNEYKSPMMYGLLFSKVVLPDTVDIFDELELKHVLTHEFVHIKYNHNLFKFLYTIALSIHWFNPIVWVCYFLMQKDLEASCDEKVVKVLGFEKNIEYAKTLFKLASKQVSFPAISYTAFGENHTKSRIESILKAKKSTVLSAALAVILALVSTIVLATNPFAKAAEISNTIDSSAPETSAVTAVTEANMENQIIEGTAKQIETFNLLGFTQDERRVYLKKNDAFSENKEYIYDRMLNTQDYLKSIEGSFERIETSNGSSYSVDYHVQFGDEPRYFETMVDCNKHVALYDGTKCYDILLDKKSGNVKDSRCSTIDSSGLEYDGVYLVKSVSRFKTDSQGIPVIYYRNNIHFPGYARESIDPGELTLGSLSDFKTWQITAEETLLNRSCYVINGSLSGDYSKKLNTKTFTMWVDTETGVLLKWIGYDGNHKISEQLITQSIKVNTKIDPNVFKPDLPVDLSKIKQNYIW